MPNQVSQSEFLDGKHCVKISHNEHSAFAIVDLDKWEEFFDFCFDRGYKVENLPFEEYQDRDGIPKFNHEDDIKIRKWHDENNIPPRLFFQDDKPFKMALDFWMHLIFDTKDI